MLKRALVLTTFLKLLLQLPSSTNRFVDDRGRQTSFHASGDLGLFSFSNFLPSKRL